MTKPSKPTPLKKIYKKRAQFEVPKLPTEEGVKSLPPVATPSVSLPKVPPPIMVSPSVEPPPVLPPPPVAPPPVILPPAPVVPIAPSVASLPLAAGPFPITFFGTEIKRFYLKKRWYFLLADILKVPAYAEGQPHIESTDAYRAVHQKIAKTLAYRDDEELKEAVGVDYQGVVQLSQLLQGTLPGPFPRWIQEVADFPAP